jgi:hypothetical protein
MRMSKGNRQWPLATAHTSRPGARSYLARRFAILLSLFLVLASLALVHGSAQQAVQQPATSAAARNAALVEATQEVLKETSAVRQLAVLRAVQSSTQSRADIERAIMKNMEDGTSAADIHASEVIMKKLAMAPPDFQYRSLIVRVLTEQVAGYYEPKTQQFHLADWIDVDGQKPIMAHELTHALQDQHFNLGRFEHWPKGDSDAELAAHALIEGDATLAMVQYVANNPLRALAFLKSMGASGIATDELDRAPRALRETLLFPYQEGLNWTRNVYRQGGWNSVSQAFKTLPQSTEQILHPGKYFVHEAPVKVTLPDLVSLLNSRTQKKAEVRSQKSVNGSVLASSVLSSSTQPPASWKRIASDVNGEWGLYLILDELIRTPQESRKAAAGWAGDHYDVYEGPQGEVLYVSVSAWDTQMDAREFFDAYLKRLQLRYPNTASEAKVTGHLTSSAQMFNTVEGRVAIQLQGSRVILCEGIPMTVNAARLVNLLRNAS